MDSKERQKLAYEKFKINHPERLAELRRKASKVYYEKHKDDIKEKRKVTREMINIVC
jgi:hypothetical protein